MPPVSTLQVHSVGHGHASSFLIGEPPRRSVGVFKPFQNLGINVSAPANDHTRPLSSQLKSTPFPFWPSDPVVDLRSASSPRIVLDDSCLPQLCCTGFSFIDMEFLTSKLSAPQSTAGHDSHSDRTPTSLHFECPPADFGATTKAVLLCLAKKYATAYHSPTEADFMDRVQC